jgi:uncharacterized protein (TIGR03435 family)
MMRIVACLAVAFLLSFTAFGQSAEKSPAFDVADVHISPPSPLPGMGGGILRDGRYEIRNATMVDLIRTAYGVEADKVLGGPSWLESTRFNVIAKTSATSQDTARLMLRTLLAERFGLKIHDDSRPLPAFVLTVGKDKPKLKPTEGSGNGCQGIPQQGPPAPGVVPYAQAACRNVTTAQIAQNLRQMAGGYLDKPVIDSTKLDGAWDFDIKWTARALLGAAGPDGISLFDAVDKQLGLKLELQQIAMPVLIVDNVNEKPTDNLPGVGSTVPAEKPEFEAAEIKPSEPGSQGLGIRYTPGGRIDAMGSLRNLIGIALEIPPNLANDTLVGGPKFLDTERYNILAKAPTTGIGAPGRDAGRETAPPIGVALAMLRALLEERFKLKTHKEDRPATVYAIVQPKTELKLKKADSASRASCRPDPSAVQGSKTPMQAWTCQNTTIADLARNIQLWAGAYIDHPVVDKTGLEGGWDFTLMWSPRNALEAPINRPADAPAGPAAAVDPGGGISVFDAVEKQLGLKLERGTHTIPVVVIDHVEQKPID